MKKIIRFLENIFSNDIGEKHPKNKKIRPKWLIYWIIGLVLAVLIPTCLVYLEAGEFSWNIAAIVWPKGDGYLARHVYFICGIVTIFDFLLLGYLTPENMNGDGQILGWKKAGRFLLILGLLLWLSSFICANILY